MKTGMFRTLTEEIPEYGDLMTMEEFIENCECGGFIDDDGHGYYASEKKMSNIFISPSDVKDKNIKKGYTHVVWFNR